MIFITSFAMFADEVVLTKVDEKDKLDIFNVSHFANINAEPNPFIISKPYKVAIFKEQYGEDTKRLASQTKTLVGMGLTTAAVISFLPKETSNWDFQDQSLGSKWVENITEGPQWDRDGPIINYVSHPYTGGIYYQMARKSGYRQWDSFIYSALMSTFFWEYGLESFAEVPSVQDLIITPVAGWVAGEWMFQAEHDIRMNGGVVFGSEFLGDVALILLDPVDAVGVGVNKLFGGNYLRAGTGYISFNQHSLPDGRIENVTELKFSYQFDFNQHYGSELGSNHDRFIDDPIDTSMVAVSSGIGYSAFDERWIVENSDYYFATIGLYFSPKFSTSLSYTASHLDYKDGTGEVSWENYNISAQHYFNTEQNLRPYLAYGFGEMIKDKDNDLKTFQLHLGAGLHYKLNPKWAVQTDWRIWHSSSLSTVENTFSLGIVYRFGKGEL